MTVTIYGRKFRLFAWYLAPGMGNRRGNSLLLLTGFQPEGSTLPGGKVAFVDGDGTKGWCAGKLWAARAWREASIA